MKPVSRRVFLRSSTTLAGSALVTPELLRLKTAQKPLRLGGPVFLKTDDPDELAREHRRLNYSARIPAPCFRYGATGWRVNIGD